MTKTVLACLALVLALSACNTFQGLGQDMKGAGETLSDSAQKTKAKINGQ